jgi:hypothetical protein
MLPLLLLVGQACAEEPSWRYDRHPLWGLSAWISVNAESVGIRCLPDREMGASVAIMFTKGLVAPTPLSRPQAKPEGIAAYKFIGSEGWGQLTATLKDGGYYEQTSMACDANLDDFREARALIFVDPSIDAETMRTAPVSALKIIARIPLNGAKAATDKLIAACRPIRRDIANGCGI